MCGATVVRAIYLKDTRLCPIAVPLAAEQRRIIATVDTLMGVCNRLEIQLTARQAERRSLLETILRQALAPMV